MANLKLLHPITSESSNNILEATKSKMGFVPNMYLKMGQNPALLDSYVYAYNNFRKNGGFSPVEQEVILLSVAFENDCRYCMAAHSFVADNMTKVPIEITNAIRNNTPVTDSKLAILSKLTKALTRNRGRVKADLIQEFIKEGYTENHVLGIITGIAVKTMSNYTNHNTEPEVDELFASRKWNPVV